jgi:hypothetical protein
MCDTSTDFSGWPTSDAHIGTAPPPFHAEIILRVPTGFAVETVLVRPARGEPGTLRRQLEICTRPTLRIYWPAANCCGG